MSWARPRPRSLIVSVNFLIIVSASTSWISPFRIKMYEPASVSHAGPIFSEIHNNNLDTYSAYLSMTQSFYLSLGLVYNLRHKCSYPCHLRSQSCFHIHDHTFLDTQFQPTSLDFVVFLPAPVPFPVLLVFCIHTGW